MIFLRATSRASGRLRQPAARGQKKMRRGRGRSPQTSLDQNLTGKGAKYRSSIVCVLSTDCRRRPAPEARQPQGALMRITVPLNLDQRSPRQRAHPVGVAPLGLSSHSKQGDSPRSALTSGSTGSAGRGSDHKRCSDAARSMQLNREVCGTSTAAIGSVTGRWPCRPGYARYPQAGRDDSRFPRSGPSVCRKKARHWRRAKSREYKTPQVAAIGSYINCLVHFVAIHTQWRRHGSRPCGTRGRSTIT